MNGFKVLVFLSVLVAIISATPSVSKDEDFSVPKEVASNSVTGQTMHLPSFLQSNKRACWVCDNPCSHGGCCDDGYPQCCLVNGECKCCRS